MIVFKIGGAALQNLTAISQDLAANRARPFIIVHGGASQVTQTANKLGVPQNFVQHPDGLSSRFTDVKTVEVFTMVTCGLLNKAIVAQLQSAGINAVGLSGADARLLIARRKDALRIMENGKQKIQRGNYSGRVENVNEPFLRLLLKQEMVPVIAPVVLSYGNELVSTDADRTAAAVAVALRATQLVFLTDVDGFFHSDRLVKEIRSIFDLEDAVSHAQGGMKKKLWAAREALQAGVEEVIVSNGLVQTPVYNALRDEKRTRIRLG